MWKTAYYTSIKLKISLTCRIDTWSSSIIFVAVNFCLFIYLLRQYNYQHFQETGMNNTISLLKSCGFIIYHNKTYMNKLSIANLAMHKQSHYIKTITEHPNRSRLEFPWQLILTEEGTQQIKFGRSHREQSRFSPVAARILETAWYRVYSVLMRHLDDEKQEEQILRGAQRTTGLTEKPWKSSSV